MNLDGEDILPDTDDWSLPGYDLFKDIIASINNKSGNLFDEDPEAAEKAYNPYIVNAIFSGVDKFGKNDTVLYANEMNVRPNISKRMQYDFYYYGLPKARRFLPFTKAESINNIELVMEYYQCSIKKAKQIIDVLTEAQIEVIKGRLFKGEIKNVKSRKSTK